jgi:hypothetical protein
MILHDLKHIGLIYLSSPYTLYPEGIDKANSDICKITARLAERGITAFSPIAHSHAVAKYGKLNPKDGAFWIKHDEIFMDRCDALLVAEMPGWEDSVGVTWEIDVFRDAEKPIYYLNPVTLEVRA